MGGKAGEGGVVLALAMTLLAALGSLLTLAELPEEAALAGEVKLAAESTSSSLPEWLLFWSSSSDTNSPSFPCT